MKKKYEILSHYVVMEKHIVELTEAEAAEADEFYILGLCDEENRIREETRDYEMVDITPIKTNRK